MGKELILAIDQGTTGTTCLLVNDRLNIVLGTTKRTLNIPLLP